MNHQFRQIPLDLRHRTAMGRADFLVAPSNADAVGWIDRWPDWGAPCLILYGAASCGKTHLAAVWREKADAAVIDPDMLQSRTAEEIAQQGKHLVIDPVGLWIGDRAAETTLFHLYNLMREEQRSLLLTLRSAPSHMDFVIADLASRLRAAPAVSIDPPDDTLLEALLVKLFHDRHLNVSQDLIAYLLPRMERSFAAAADLVAQADHASMAEKRPVSIPLLRRLLRDSD